MELFAPLDPEKVDELGGKYYLGLPQSEIDRIRKDYQSPTRRKEAYLDLYVHQHPCPIWSEIARILHMVNLRQQADLVENTYVKGIYTRTTVVRLLSAYQYSTLHVYNRKPLGLITNLLSQSNSTLLVLCVCVIQYCWETISFLHPHVAHVLLY